MGDARAVGRTPVPLTAGQLRVVPLRALCGPVPGMVVAGAHVPPVLPILRCGSCGAPVRWATAVEAVWNRKYGGWPNPVGECLFCGPEGRARAGVSS